MMFKIGRTPFLLRSYTIFLNITSPSRANQIKKKKKKKQKENKLKSISYKVIPPGRVAQSVTCLATDACLTADPGVASSIPIRSHTFVEIDHEMISTVILLPSADSFKLQAKVCAQITGQPLVQACPGKSVVR